MVGLFRFCSFSAKKENLFFGYFYFTAEKVKSIFGRPLYDMKPNETNAFENSQHGLLSLLTQLTVRTRIQ